MINLLNILADFIKQANPIAKAWITSGSLALFVVIFFYKRDNERELNCQESLNDLTELHRAEIKALNESFRARQDVLEEEMVQDAIRWKNVIQKELDNAKVTFKRVESKTSKIKTKLNEQDDYLDKQINNYENNSGNTLSE